MTKVIRRIGVLSAGRIAGLVYGSIGLIVGMFVALFGGLAGLLGSHGSAGGFLGAGALGFLAILVLPVVYGCVAALCIMLGALIFNVAAGLVGGLEVEAD